MDDNTGNGLVLTTLEAALTTRLRYPIFSEMAVSWQRVAAGNRLSNCSVAGQNHFVSRSSLKASL